MSAKHGHCPNAQLRTQRDRSADQRNIPALDRRRSLEYVSDAVLNACTPSELQMCDRGTFDPFGNYKHATTSSHDNYVLAPYTPRQSTVAQRFFPHTIRNDPPIPFKAILD
jgi:hypothetical protein